MAKRKKKDKDKPEPGFVLTYTRLAILGGTVLSLLGTFSTLLYKSMSKQLDELKDSIEKLDKENDGEREKDRERFEDVDKRFDENNKKGDERFDKLEDRMTRMEMRMQAQRETETQSAELRKKKRRRRTSIWDAYDFMPGIGESDPVDVDKYESIYGEKAMEEARGVGVARVLEPWSNWKRVKQQCDELEIKPWICKVCETGDKRLCEMALQSVDQEPKQYSEAWFAWKDASPTSAKESRKLRRAERKAKRQCRRKRGMACIHVKLPSNILSASDTLAKHQNYEASLSRSLRSPARQSQSPQPSQDRGDPDGARSTGE